MYQKLTYVTGAAIIATLGLVQSAQATTITFDSTITAGAHAATGGQPGFVAGYTSPGPNAFPPDSDAFKTQGFVFGGYTVPLTAVKTAPELDIMLNSALCPANVGATCASDGSRYLIGGEPFSMFVDGGVNFSMTSFSGTGVFDAAGCPNCDPSGPIFPALFIKVMGVRLGAPNSGIVADEVFALTSGFQTFTLTDPDWVNVSKVIFRPVDANGNQADRIFAVDNVNATAVPEPATFVLVASGLLAAGARWRKAKASA